jgi:hypothetical protein
MHTPSRQVQSCSHQVINIVSQIQIHIQMNVHVQNLHILPGDQDPVAGVSSLEMETPPSSKIIDVLS